MNRREVVTGLALVAALCPSHTTAAQEAGNIRRIGLLAPGLDNPVTRPAYQSFLAELSKLGFVEGRNIAVVHRRIDEGAAKATAAASELVGERVELIVAIGPEVSLQAAIAAKTGKPIVVAANNYDLLSRGYVTNLSRPSGDITGVFYRQPELAVKQLVLLKEAFPQSTHVAALWDAQSEDQFKAAEVAARGMPDVALRSIELKQQPYDFEVAFQRAKELSAQMILVLSSPFFTPHRERIAELAIRHRLPSMFIFREYVEAGGLMSFGVVNAAMYRLAASYAAKILRGARPVNLPIQQAANFEFVINLKTAKLIGVELPTSILLRADEVIE